MKKQNTATIGILLTAGLLFAGMSAAAEVPQKQKIANPCKQCHQPAETTLRGDADNISQAAGIIQINTGAIWTVKFDETTKVTGWKKEEIADLPKGRSIAVSYVEKNGMLHAETISVKKPAKLAEEKLIKVEELAKLAAIGPEKGNFVLVDSRPAPKFNEGYIPGAIVIYDAEFDKHLDKLPKEKDKLLIFYCAGTT